MQFKPLLQNQNRTVILHDRSGNYREEMKYAAKE
mgnify:CR=1 FL=1